ncbi:hypothetical protein EDB19DRAFT_464652 [Suillus lakei]|nr:hypothetical protein EDB19DRAFT_464652 [Suillus lakei]
MASGGIPIDIASMISIAMESILYGFSVLMFMGTIWALTYKRSIHDINRPIAAVATLLFMLSTAHMVVDIIRIEDGLVTYRDTFPGGAAAFFADVSQETYVIKNVIYIFQTLLADGVVIFRCYVVWQSIWVIILPSMLWCSSAVTGYYGIYRVAQATSNIGNIFANDTAQWITAFFASTLATNLMGSGLLAYRIWIIERNVSAVCTTKGPMMPILRVLVDAAVLYSVVLLATLICFVYSSNAQYILLDMLMPIISIAFYMVLVRVSINKHTSSYLSTRRRGTVNETQRGTPHIPMKPLQVHISQFMHKDDASAYGIENHGQPSKCNAEIGSCNV